jgi:hypothetical protein
VGFAQEINLLMSFLGRAKQRRLNLSEPTNFGTAKNSPMKRLRSSTSSILSLILSVEIYLGINTSPF